MLPTTPKTLDEHRLAVTRTGLAFDGADRALRDARRSGDRTAIAIATENRRDLYRQACNARTALRTAEDAIHTAAAQQLDESDPFARQVASF